jgi:hypothetical protein
MYYALSTLHTIFNAYSIGIKLVAMGILAVVWLIGRTKVEYAEALKRHSTGGILIPTICSRLAMLLGLAVIIDGMWFHTYRNIILAAGLLLAMLFAMVLCQRLAGSAAHRTILANGYERAAAPILPKQRGS